MSDTDDMPFPFPVAETVDYDTHDAALRESAEWEMSAELATLRADLLAADVERLRKLVAKLRWRLRARGEVLARTDRAWREAEAAADQLMCEAKP